MAERRGLLTRLFGRRAPNVMGLTYVDSSGSAFTRWSGDPYSSEIVRACIDAVARNGAKLKPHHIRRVNGKIAPPPSDSVERIVSIRPNPRMSTYDLLYKTIATTLINNNAFQQPEWDAAGNLVAIWPVTCVSSEFLEDSSGTLFVRFTFADGTQTVKPYDELIHIRRHFGQSPIAGDNNDPLNATLEIISTTNQSLAAAVKASSLLRGILKYTMNLSDKDKKASRDAFVADIADVAKSGGVAVTDSKGDYIELKGSPITVNALQMQELRNNIYRYFGVSEAIVTSAYDENEWAAFYESVIEPFAIQLSLEYTAKLFTNKERGFGNEIVFESNRLQYASIKSKLDLDRMVDRGAMTPNQWREVFNQAPLPGGDEPIRRLDTAPTNQTGKGEDDEGQTDGE